MDIATTRAAALWVALHLLLLLLLSVRVVRQRVKHGVQIGDGGVPELICAVRAFGNTAEYAPAGLAALLAMALVQAPMAMIQVAGGALLAGRVIHAVGLSRTTAPSRSRVVGMTVTWLSYIFMIVALLFYAIG